MSLVSFISSPASPGTAAVRQSLTGEESENDLRWPVGWVMEEEKKRRMEKSCGGERKAAGALTESGSWSSSCTSSFKLR